MSARVDIVHNDRLYQNIQPGVIHTAVELEWPGFAPWEKLYVEGKKEGTRYH